MKFDKFSSVACAAVLLSSCNNESLEIAQNQNEPSQESVEVTIGDEVKGYARIIGDPDRFALHGRQTE